MDGIDAALLKSDGYDKVDILAHFSLSYEKSFQKSLKASLDDSRDIKNRLERPGNLKKIERELTEKHVTAVHGLLNRAGMKSQNVDFIGFHGQTLLHKPDQALTVQIGDGQWLADKTGIDVVFDMRANDMKHGGQGAPLVPAYHQALAKKLSSSIHNPIAFVNIGGIANTTWIDGEKIYAFDCGPGNALIDQWIRQKTKKFFDKNGKIGIRGKLNKNIIEYYLKHDYFQDAVPRSLDWRSFQSLSTDDVNVEDGAATLSYITAYGIFHSFRHVSRLPKTLIVSGGGVHNLSIMKWLQWFAGKFQSKLFTAEDMGFHADFMEAEAWAYLAIRSFYHLPLTYHTTTGTSHPVSGGVWVSPQNTR
ncbi:hypothetical protein MEG_00443 [Bartonella tamiae Th307]|uniref:Anhydro-N-acetylmuramic acid kinase n=2 Tax=Bartonella tamiae TaxID=373638 RepID=J0ZKK3_9HYPH|nr:hypothetical protein ME5_01439 [Bartonella tamiae Th239]EJF94862.1 hypothetical protein MEG_00443 [Bartonella tamiae Th307]